MLLASSPSLSLQDEISPLKSFIYVTLIGGNFLGEKRVMFDSVLLDKVDTDR